MPPIVITMSSYNILKKRNIFKLLFAFFCLMSFYTLNILSNFKSLEDIQTIHVDEPFKIKWTHWLILKGHKFKTSYCNQYPTWKIVVIESEMNYGKNMGTNCVSWNAIPEQLKESVKDVDPIHQAFLFAILNEAEYVYTPNKNTDIVEMLERTKFLLSKSHKFHTFSDEENYFQESSYFHCPGKGKCLKNLSQCLTAAPSLLTPVALGNAKTKSYTSEMVPVAMMPKTFTSINGECTVVGRLAFWTLPLFYEYYHFSHETKFRMGCLVQWFLWQMGGFVEVIWVPSSAHRTLHKMPEECWSLVDSLQHCKQSLVDCILIAIRSISTQESYDRYERWMDSLNKHGYTFTRKNIVRSNCTNFVINAAEYCKELNLVERYSQIINLDTIIGNYESTCKKGLESLVSINFKESGIQREDLLLMIVFNNAHFNVIPYLEIMYRPHFRHILYCSAKSIDARQFTFLEGFDISYITYDFQTMDNIPGSLSYQCMLKALQMNFTVSGILSISDDLLLLKHQLSWLNTDRFWFISDLESKIGDLKTLNECKLSMCSFLSHWPWWTAYRNSSLDLLDDLDYLSKASKIVRQFKQNLEKLTGGKSRLVGGYSDVYYVPLKYAAEFCEVAELFLNHQVFLEIAIPSVIFGLVSKEEIEVLPGLAVWDVETRDRPWVHFKKPKLFGMFYLHPVKWSSLGNKSSAVRPSSLNCTTNCGNQISYNLNNTAEMTSLFCDYVLPYFSDPMGELPEKSVVV